MGAHTAQLFKHIDESMTSRHTDDASINGGGDFNVVCDVSVEDNIVTSKAGVSVDDPTNMSVDSQVL